MSTAITTTGGKSLSEIVKNPKYASRINEVLKDRSPQFVSSLIQIGNSLGDDCEPTSIIASAMTAAALNLPIDKNLGFAWLVPYKGKYGKVAQFQMGYKGYIQLALRTGQYSRLNVCEVYEGELEKYDKLTGDLVINTASKKSDKIVGYASYLKLTSGFEHSEYWAIEEVEAHAKRYSQAYRSGYETPWKTHFDEMAMKTVLGMHIRKWGPMTTAEAKAHSADNAVIRDIDLDPEFIDNPTGEPVAKPSKPAIAKKAPETQVIVEAPAPEAPDPTNVAKENPPLKAVSPNMTKLLEMSSGLDFEKFKGFLQNLVQPDQQADVQAITTWGEVTDAYADIVMATAKRISNMKVLCARD